MLDCPIVGISAGAMNCGKTVLNSSQKIKQPALPLFLEGLALSDFIIEPHFEKKKQNSEQMKLIFEASKQMEIYGLRDGSYLFDGKVYGKCEVIFQSKIIPLSEDGEVVLLDKEMR